MNEGVLLGRIVLAAALGFAIGWEREIRGSAVGRSTIGMVGLGAATLVALTRTHLSGSAGIVFGGLLIGMGLLGASVVFAGQGRTGDGLLGAGALWSTGAVAALVATGRYGVGIVAAVVILLLLELDRLPPLAGSRYLGRSSLRSEVPAAAAAPTPTVYRGPQAAETEPLPRPPGPDTGPAEDQP
jgi:uncharacterized membrane protein YhiD involved in acid resistance